jgi:hypothetical protein
MSIPITKENIRVYNVNDASLPYTIKQMVFKEFNSKAFFISYMVRYTMRYTLFNSLSELNEEYQKLLLSGFDGELNYGVVLTENYPTLDSYCVTQWRTQGVKYIFTPNFEKAVFTKQKLLFAPAIHKVRKEIVSIAGSIFNQKFNYDNATITSDDYETFQYFINVISMNGIHDNIKEILPYDHTPIIYLDRDRAFEIEKDLMKNII